MAKKKKITQDAADEAKWSQIPDDAQYDMLVDAFLSLADQLAEAGADPELTSAALFGVFMNRMTELGDREEYEAILEEALDTPWEEHTIH